MSLESSEKTLPIPDGFEMFLDDMVWGDIVKTFSESVIPQPMNLFVLGGDGAVICIQLLDTFDSTGAKLITFSVHDDNGVRSWPELDRSQQESVLKDLGVNLDGVVLLKRLPLAMLAYRLMGTQMKR